MKWEELTAPDFARAVKKTRGTCIVPIGVIEKHGDHLPLGTDFLMGKWLAEAAALREPAVVFPPFYFGEIHVAMPQPGTIAIDNRVMFDLLEQVCDEIARNGFKKILLLNAHGGNRHYLPYFAQSMLARRRDYVVYTVNYYELAREDDPRWKKMKQSTVDGHGGECETSMMLAAFPELVRMQAIAAQGLPLGRLKHLDKHVFTGVAWYADFPRHYAGNGSHGSLAKGRYLVEECVKRCAQIIRQVKRDETAPRLTKEFYLRVRG